MINTYTAKYTKIEPGYMGQMVEWPEVITEGEDPGRVSGNASGRPPRNDYGLSAAAKRSPGQESTAGTNTGRNIACR